MTSEKSVAIKELALPTSLEETRGFADAFVKSGMFSDTKSLAAAIVKIQAGRELGLPPVYSMQNINLIRDRLTTSANTLAMLVKKSGRYNYRIKSHTEQGCSIMFYELDNGKWVEVGESTFTMEDAKRAGLVRPDSGWTKFPRAMLFSRAISQGARIYCPDAIGGIYTDEEIRAIPPRPGEEPEPLPEPPPTATPDSPAQSPPVASEGQGGIIPPKEQEKPANPQILANGLNLDDIQVALREIQWADVAVYLRSHFKVEGKRIGEMLAKLSKEQAIEFVKEIETRKELQ